ncbi:methyl-accepting chemotaxis protein [Anaeromicropila herbilytica]|uniref:Methyl-accepting chemotaxis protein n=1 Tax=Anaeromicropila herbilytica TaxID=2785025 RepID=A0A7R7EK89_9FIRM|nr:HAMP domain-containing methyl-accepting chemotaxis protein [Anaeromicropila herbilytica]BCN30136.1 hypothetical protein bsdtb5_14310 [Anaeromicropila herbilytica]
MQNQKQKKSRLSGNTVAAYLHRAFTIVGFIIGPVVVIASIFTIILSYLMFQEGKNLLGIVGVIVTVLLIIFVVVIDLILYRVANKVTSKIMIPIEELEQSMNQLAVGNLETQILYSEEDEFGKVANDTRKTIYELKKYIQNITDILKDLTNKNMTATVDIEYLGDFKPIKESLENITSTFNDMLINMKKSFVNINEGSENLAMTAQSLASGAANQQKEVKELVDNINEVSENVSTNANNANHVADISMYSLNQFEAGNQKMQQLLKAMESIRVQSDEISKIIQVIDGIAQQTNLLSLNASIEAARAGEQGKGFAVVASEIGKLAGECGAAAQTTTNLITNSIQSVKEGSAIAEETAELLIGVVDSSKESTELVKEISKACKEQDVAIKKVLNSVQNIENVVELNSSAAEESSALSEELLASVEVIMSQIGQYQLEE